jgi:hypothetical protein
MPSASWPSKCSRPSGPVVQNGSQSKVLQTDGEKLLVEFHTPGKNFLGRRRVYRTVEWVTPHEPDRIDFEGVEGPLSLLCDRFDLTNEGGCTWLTYESEFGLKGWFFGWLVSRFYVQRTLRKMMHEHLEEMKETIEARAERSRALLQRPCSPMDAQGELDHVTYD